MEVYREFDLKSEEFVNYNIGKKQLSDLIFKWFGEHPNYAVINNGADIAMIRENSYNSDMLKSLFDVHVQVSCFCYENGLGGC